MEFQYCCGADLDGSVLSCSESMLSVIDDSLVSDFDHQIAGHTTDKVRRYQHQYILKPQNKVDLFQREVRFYEDIFGDAARHAAQIEFLAQYHGVSLIDNGCCLLPHLILDDLTTGYGKPCVIDIKMGRQSFEPSATREKKEREVRKYPHQAEVGFRITGVKVWDDAAGKYHYRNKAFGRSVLPERAVHAMASCFFNGKALRTDVVANLLLRFEALLAFMRVQTRYKFYCSSILVVYDAMPHSRGDAQRCLELFGRSYCADESDLTRSAVIDFARAVPSEEEVDEGFVYGLESLIAKLRGILDVVRSADATEMESFLSAMHCVFAA